MWQFMLFWMYFGGGSFETMNPNIEHDENVPQEGAADVEINDIFNRFARVSRNDNRSQTPFHNAAIVVFDLDTTDVTRSRKICQISARCNNNTFNQYILPNRDICFRSSQINGLHVRQIGINERRLFHNGIEVNAVNPIVGLTNFVDFLSRQTDGKVLLVAHKCFTFDGSTLVREMTEYNLMETFQSCVSGLVDTLKIFQSMVPERKEENRSFNLSTLAADYLDENNIPGGQHAAVNVDILVSLIDKIGFTDEIMKQYAMSLNMFIQLMPENVEVCIAGLGVLNQQNNLPPGTREISKAKLKQLAKAGISIDMLSDVYANTGEHGISELLQENIGGSKPRVTNNQRIIRTIINRLEAFLADH